MTETIHVPIIIIIIIIIIIFIPSRWDDVIWCYSNSCPCIYE